MNAIRFESTSAAAVADLSIDWLITNGVFLAAPITREAAFCVGASFTAWIRILLTTALCNWPSDAVTVSVCGAVLSKADVYWMLPGCRT